MVEVEENLVNRRKTEEQRLHFGSIKQETSGRYVVPVGRRGAAAFNLFYE